MRLINTTTFELQEFGDVRPSYAILSHTWEEDEVLFEDMKDLETARQKTGFYKIEKTCARAAASTLKWAWIDTCCIDKSSSSELSEAINSMFSWYTDAMACYAFITDVDRDDDEWMLKFEKSRWLTRGWTLQELLAPRIIDFFDKSWKYLGSKKGLTVVLSLATRIDADILTQAKPISSEPVGKRMSWAANRQTTRKEDMAYCLLGIFDVNMPMLYGEGHKAFRRLQEEIIRTTSDLSLFAWQSAPDLPYTLSRHNTWSEILARYPSEFRACDKLVRKAGPARTNEFSLTNAGLRMSNMLKVFQSATPRPNSYVLPLNCMTESGKKGREIGVYIALCGHSLYVRVHHGEICLIPRFNAMDFFQSPNS
ncbi:heterokaryon incompatibility protein-domain-containing protein [Xylariales sp. PMI_506]|nr:heterokaryon incompatibility protein-domain-containing protein [Xylariales sp. PMI_506]